MSCKILSVGAKEGKAPLVIITALNDEKKQKYVISEGTYREIGCPLSGEELDGDSLYILCTEDEKRRALAKALRILSYADNNKLSLKRKLRLAGFSTAAVDYAISECVMLGYVNEEAQIERIILKHASELLGPYKIKAKLMARQYSSSLVSKTLSALISRGEIDFKECKLKLLSTKLDKNATYDEKMKLLYKYGYIK